MTTEFPKRMPRRQAADYLRDAHGLICGWQRLAKLAVIGEGPAFRKDGRWPLYDRAALDEWAEWRLGKVARSTAEHGCQNGFGGRPKRRETA